MKKKLFFAVAFFAFIPQLLLWGMDETIFPGTAKEYGTDGWQTPEYVIRGPEGAFEPPLIMRENQKWFTQAINTFNPEKQKEFENIIRGYSFDTAWYLLLVGRDAAWYYYPLQAHLELSISKDIYKSRIFEILIDMGAPIQNIKGYSPFRHILNLIIRCKNKDMCERYKKCVDILIHKGFNFDVPLAKNNGHYTKSNPDAKDLIDVDSQATGRICIAKAIEYCQKNQLDDIARMLGDIKHQIDAIPVASTIATSVPVSEKKSTEVLTAPPSGVGIVDAGVMPYVLVKSSSKSNESELSIDASNLKPLSFSSASSNPPLQSHTGQGPISSVPHVAEPKPSLTTALNPLVPDVLVDKPVKGKNPSSIKSRLLEWCNTTASTTIKKNVCVLVMGAVTVLAATKLMYSKWSQKKSSVGNDTSFPVILENMTKDELLIETGGSFATLSSKNSQNFDLNAVSKLTIKSNTADTADNISKDMNIYLWLYKQYRRSGTLHIIIKPETARWKRWLFGTQYTYTASWQ